MASDNSTLQAKPNYISLILHKLPVRKDFNGMNHAVGLRFERYEPGINKFHILKSK